jgi:exodeoxyribonuclease V alpha subunit
MSGYPGHLRALVDDGQVEERDLRAAAVYVDLSLRHPDSPERASAQPALTDNVWRAMATTLAAFRDQHTCLELEQHPGWEEELRNCTNLVAEPHTINVSRRQPFILDLHRLYLHRSWEEECFVAETLRTRSVDKLKVITGGPGTGKTTLIAKQMVERFSEPSDIPVVVALVAPTGKAANRMTEAMTKALTEAKAPQHVYDIVLASPARTIHSLLGANPHRVDHRFTYHAANKLKQSIVIVDETSMLSLSMMYHLLSALDKEAELILVGDPDQLASVEAGTVLADVVAGFPATRVHKLTKQHRFKDCPNIVETVKAVREGDVERTIAAISIIAKDIEWIDPFDAPDAADKLLDEVVDHARGVIGKSKSGALREAFAMKTELQVLCAHRKGKMGVEGWNRIIEKRLGIGVSNQWYEGRPIIVTENDRTTGLFNGDVAVIGKSDDHRVACFSEEPAKAFVPVTRLPAVETVHALTIHKSQGSEYEHAVVVLPNAASRILTRELFYTGITRAKEKLTIIGTVEVIREAIGRPIRRATGLAERLKLASSPDPRD